MSGTHTHSPRYKILIKECQIKGIDEFVKTYSCYGIIVGESDSVKFLEEKIEEYNRRDTQVG